MTKPRGAMPLQRTEKRLLYSAALGVISVIGMTALGVWYGWQGSALGEPAPAPSLESRLEIVQPQRLRDQLVGVPGAALPESGQTRQTWDGRFLLAGTVVGGTGGGVALIAVDGKAARAFRLGDELAPGYALHSVGEAQAMLAESANAPVRVVLSVSQHPMPGVSHTPAASVYLSGPEKAVGWTAPATAPSPAAAFSAAAMHAAVDGQPPPRQDSRYSPSTLPRH
jgi:hypothetical protein